MAKTPYEARVLLVHQSGKPTFRLHVPEGWHVTFQNSKGLGSLRLYKGQDQRACFVGVDSFRDAALKMERKTTTVHCSSKPDGEVTWEPVDLNEEEKNAFKKSPYQADTAF